MEPAGILTLIGVCMTIATKATSFITSITDLRTRYRNVEFEIEVLKSRTRTVRDAADRLRDWLDRNGAVLEEADRLAILESVEACERLISRLDEVAGGKTNVAKKSSKKMIFKDKFKYLLAQPNMDRIAASLSSQVAALNFHIHTLHLPDPSARQEKRLRRKSRRITDTAKSSANEIALSVSSEATDSEHESGSGSDSDSATDAGSTNPTVDSGYVGSGIEAVSIRASLTEVNLKKLQHDGDPGPGSSAPMVRRYQAYVSSKDDRAARILKRSNWTQDIPTREAPLRHGPSLALSPGGMPRERQKDNDRDPSGSSSGSSNSGTSRDNTDDALGGSGWDESRGTPASSDSGGTIRGSSRQESDTSHAIFNLPNITLSAIGPALSLVSGLQDTISSWDGSQIGEERIFRHLRKVKEEVKLCAMTGSSSSSRTNLETEIDALFQQVEQMLNGPAQRTSTEFMSAVGSGDTAQIEGLVRNGADIHACNDRGQTALHLAAGRLDVETMGVLIRLGGSLGTRRLLEAVDENGNTPLLAIDYDGGFWKVTNAVKCLAGLEGAEAVINVRAHDGYTALHRAAEKGALGAMEWLLYYDADPDPKHNSSRITPLHKACCTASLSKVKSVDLLLKKGVCVESISKDGDTPLDICLQYILRTEREIDKLSFTNGPLGYHAAALYRPCRRLRVCMETIIVLCGHLSVTNLWTHTSVNLTKSFLFRDFQSVRDILPDETRRRLRKIFISTVLASDEDLHRDIRAHRRRQNSTR